MMRLRSVPPRGVRILAALAAACALALFRTATPSSRAAATSPASMAGPDLKVLSGFPRLQVLQRAGELPTEAAMRRDLFLFDGPRPVPVRIAAEPMPVQPAPPEDPERVLALASAPRGLRYLGFLRGAPAGLLGAFMAGEEPLTLQPGTVRDGWRLVEVVEEAATFRSLRFPDLALTLRAKGDS